MKATPFAAQFAGRTAIGTWSQVRDPDLIDMLGGAGYDFTILDCEHGALDVGALPGLVRACEAAGVAPWARAPSCDAAWIVKALDSGVRGIVVPGVESAEALASVIAATRYAPAGRRGACPIVRSGGHVVADWARYAEQENEAVGVVALVESVAGLENIESLCAVPGLSAMMVGPFDLSVELGFGGDLSAPAVQGAIETVLNAARERALPVIVPVFAAEADALATQALHWRERGAAALTVGADKVFFLSAARQFRRAAFGEA